jgi:hypothetical protein
MQMRSTESGILSGHRHHKLGSDFIWSVLQKDQPTATSPIPHKITQETLQWENYQENALKGSSFLVLMKH